MFHLQTFINTAVTGRGVSLFAADIEANKETLEKEIRDKSVLVIGGAGTIGSSFVRAVLPFRPKRLVVVDINENGLTELTRDLRSTAGMFVPGEYVTYPMSYSDPVFEKMFRHYSTEGGGFDIVANFSAHKHVRSEKDIYSVEALLQNNVLRARGLLELLKEFPPRHFFCVSTDKAANPVNIMGGSKKIMEDMIMAYSEFFPVTTARFANVAFSSGSLPEGWLRRIEQKQPLSAPNDVTRYFVSPLESGEICMLACVLGHSGEVYFPKLDRAQVMTFSEMALRLLRSLGYGPLECGSEAEAIQKAGELREEGSGGCDNGTTNYPVYFSGSNTTGEKAYEEFFTADETVDMARYQSLGVVTEIQPRPMADIDALFADLNAAFARPALSKPEIVRIMQQFLPNFDHHETGQYLDSKM